MSVSLLSPTTVSNVARCCAERTCVVPAAVGHGCCVPGSWKRALWAFDCWSCIVRRFRKILGSVRAPWISDSTLGLPSCEIVVFEGQ
jgi:hypothetical protein